MLQYPYHPIQGAAYEITALPVPSGLLYPSPCRLLRRDDRPASTDTTTAPTTTDAPVTEPEKTPLTDAEQMLSVGKDGFVYNGMGEEVVLCGITLSGWLRRNYR
ncbi:MAG: hypothetical protein IJX47_01645 [Clostridia bacterium]|nr:hypothetical protein [Clostridia bacterium]